MVAICLAGCVQGSDRLIAPRSSSPAATFDHFTIQVADLDASAIFYRDLFGLAEIPSPVPGLRWFDLGSGTQLHLVPGRTAAVADNMSVHLALATTGMDAFVETLRRRRIHWWDSAGTEGAVGRRPDGVRQIYLVDPDGYWIEVNDRVR